MREVPHLRLVSSGNTRIPVVAEPLVLMSVGEEIFACFDGHWDIAGRHPRLKLWLDRIANSGPRLHWPITEYPGSGMK